MEMLGFGPLGRDPAHAAHCELHLETLFSI